MKFSAHILLGVVLVAGCMTGAQAQWGHHAPNPNASPQWWQYREEHRYNSGSGSSEPFPAPTVPAYVFNSLGMIMVWVPPGEFMMGSDETIEALQMDYPLMERRRLEDLKDEAPVHKVHITHAMYVATTKVTVGQFRKFLELSGYVPESIADGTGGYGYNPAYDPSTTVRGDLFEGRNPRYSWRNPGFAQTDADPVVNVTWNDAQALAQWLTKTEGKTYRLPTEAEWEYCARAGTTTRYYNGNDPQGLIKIANVFNQSTAVNWPKLAQFAIADANGFAFTSPVGSFAPNAFGLYDMLGNAWEWTHDLYGEDYYARAPVDDPQGPAEGHVYVRRGGSWHTWPLYARASFRNWNTPETRYVLVGMRLVMEAP